MGAGTSVGGYVAGGDGGSGIRVGVFGLVAFVSGIVAGGDLTVGVVASLGSEQEAFDGQSSFVTVGGGEGLVGSLSVSRPVSATNQVTGPVTVAIQGGIGGGPSPVTLVGGAAWGGHHRLGGGREGRAARNAEIKAERRSVREAGMVEEQTWAGHVGQSSPSGGGTVTPVSKLDVGVGDMSVTGPGPWRDGSI